MNTSLKFPTFHSTSRQACAITSYNNVIDFFSCCKVRLVDKNGRTCYVYKRQINSFILTIFMKMSFLHVGNEEIDWERLSVSDLDIFAGRRQN